MLTICFVVYNNIQDLYKALYMHVNWLDKFYMHLLCSWEAGSVLHNQEKHCNVPPQSEVQILDTLLQHWQQFVVL